MNTPTNLAEDESRAADSVFEQAREGAGEMVESSEECVRDNPFPAVMASLGSGLLIGILIGWRIAEARHRDYRELMRERARSWKRRLHMD